MTRFHHAVGLLARERLVADREWTAVVGDDEMVCLLAALGRRPLHGLPGVVVVQIGARLGPRGSVVV